MMRLASALMVLTLMSTSVISGTFAKYVTSDNATDTARVAKWGVTVTATTTDNTGKVFTNEYTTDESGDGAYTGKAVYTAVDSLVAPGTKNEDGITFTVSGEPEVACEVKIEVAGLDADNNFDVNANVVDVLLPNGTYDDLTTADTTDEFTVAVTDKEGYFPVVYTLTHNGTSIASGDLAAIQTALESITTEYDPSSTNAELNEVYKLTWAWEFEGNEQADTYLGNVAAETIDDDTASTEIKFGVKVSVTQID